MGIVIDMKTTLVDTCGRATSLKKFRATVKLPGVAAKSWVEEALSSVDLAVRLLGEYPHAQKIKIERA